MLPYILLLFHFLVPLSRALQIPLTQDGASPLDGDFNDLVQRTMNYWHVPGLSIAVVDGIDIYSQVMNFYVGRCTS